MSILTQPEGFITGMASKMFVVAGPVIVFGTLASVVYGVVLMLLWKKGAPRVAVHKTGFTKQIIWQLPDKGC